MSINYLLINNNKRKYDRVSIQKDNSALTLALLVVEIVSQQDKVYSNLYSCNYFDKLQVCYSLFPVDFVTVLFLSVSFSISRHTAFNIIPIEKVLQSLELSVSLS